MEGNPGGAVSRIPTEQISRETYTSLVPLAILHKLTDDSLFYSF